MKRGADQDKPNSQNNPSKQSRGSQQAKENTIQAEMDLRAQLKVTSKGEEGKQLRVACFCGGGDGCLPLHVGRRLLRWRQVTAEGGEEVAGERVVVCRRGEFWMRGQARESDELVLEEPRKMHSQFQSQISQSSQGMYYT
jgi:hypothetical protein